MGAETLDFGREKHQVRDTRAARTLARDVNLHARLHVVTSAAARVTNGSEKDEESLLKGASFLVKLSFFAVSVLIVAGVSTSDSMCTVDSRYKQPAMAYTDDEPRRERRASLQCGAA